MKWIKITTDIFDDEKILLIESLPEADSIIIIWFKLLCLAGKMNNSGVFMMNDKIAYTDKMLSTIFRRRETTVQLALKTFEKFGMIETINDVITIPNWNKHQSLDVLEKKREYQRELMRKRRAEQKLICDANGETNCEANSEANVSPLEREGDKNKKESRKESVRETSHTLFQRLVSDYIFSEALQTKIGEWITYKTEWKEPYKEQGMKSLLRQIENNAMKYGDSAVCDLIEECMASGWKGIIFDRLKNKPVKPSNNNDRIMNRVSDVDNW